MGESVGYWGSYSLEQGNLLQNHKIIHNHLIFLFRYHFLVHFLIISRSTYLIYDYIESFGVRCEFLWGNCWLLWHLRPVTGDYHAKFSNNSQLLNIFILSSFFISLCHHFKVHIVEICLYWDFLGKSWGSLG